MIEAQWLGGPEDGEWVALSDGIDVLRVPVRTQPVDYRSAIPAEMQSPGYRVVEVPVRMVRGRWRLLWDLRI